MPETSFVEISPRDRSIASLIFGFLLACYLLTYTGIIQSSDGLAMFATVESMVRRGEIDSNQLLWMDIQQGSFGPDGELYSRKGLGMPLLAFPLVWLANFWSVLGLTHTALLLNPLLTAWTGALVFRSGRRLDWGRTASLLCALAFGLATLAWPYTQTFFSDPVAAWGLFGAFYGMLAYSQTGRKRYLMMAGMAWGLAYLSRVVNLVTLPVYLSLLMTVIVRSVGRSLKPDVVRNLWAILVHNWRAFASFMLPVVVAGFGSLWWNWLRYGSIWDSGYVEAESFSADWLFGISGLLVGPARGVIWYAPILLLALLGSIWFWRHKRWILITFIALSLLYVALYGKWFMWHGGFSWGPRFMVALMPFWSLLAGPVFVYVAQSPAQSSAHPSKPAKRPAMRGARLLVGILLLLSIIVQWLGMLAPFGLVQNWLVEQVQPLFAPETFTRLSYSPLVVQWRFIQGETVPFGWWRAADTGSFDWFALFISLLGIIFGGLLIIRQIGADQRTDSTTASPDSTLISSDASGPRYWIYSTALILLTLALLTHYQTSLTDPAMNHAADVIERGGRKGDAVLHLRPTLTQQFANHYHGGLPTYGLFGRDALENDDQQWLDHLRQTYERLWVIAAPGLPETSGWERTLRTDDFLLDGGQSDMVAAQRVTLYGLAASQGLVEHGLGAIFGTVEEGQSLSAENGQVRLNGYASLPTTNLGAEVYLTLRWESLQKVEQNFHVFVHVLTMDGDMIAQRDGQPVQWMRPISTWEPGDLIVDRYALLLPNELSPGRYRMSVGLYDPVSGERLPVNTGTLESAVELEPFEILP